MMWVWAREVVAGEDGMPPVLEVHDVVQRASVGIALRLHGLDSRRCRETASDRVRPRAQPPGHRLPGILGARGRTPAQRHEADNQQRGDRDLPLPVWRVDIRRRRR